MDTTAVQAKERRRPHALEMALQPIVDLTSGRVVGVESLARFADRRPPEAHFAEAATRGRRIALELRAVRAGIARIGELPRDAYLTINVSPETAATGKLAEILADAPAGRIVLELTEHAPVGDYEALSIALEALRSRGLRVAVDDAGAGFASLHHVLALRPDVIKLDLSIIRGINADPRRRELVRALVQFSRATGCTLVAEGIETREELAEVRTLGVRCGQGFWLGRPEQDAAGPWQLALPKMQRRHSGIARSFGRVGRPARVLLAAAIAWPGIVAVAGLKTPSVGETLPKPPIAVLRTDLGGSTQRAAEATGPATAQPPVVRAVQTARAVAKAATPVVEPPAPKKPALVPGTVQTVGGAVGGVLETTEHTVEGVLDTTEQVVTGLTKTLGGLLGGKRAS